MSRPANLAAVPQLRADGSLRHLLTLEGLPTAILEGLLERARHYTRPLGLRAARSKALDGVTVATLFTEPSTRTRVSFELAARRLGADVASVEASQVSLMPPGTIAAMGKDEVLDLVAYLVSGGDRKHKVFQPR